MAKRWDRVFFFAGEASGDAYAAALADALLHRGLNPRALEGVGGALFARRAARMIADSRAWGAISIVESVKVGVNALRGVQAARAALQTGPPGLFIPIDYGYVNVKLCRLAQACGWTVLYFIPPGSWKRPVQARDLPQLTDAIVTPFSWSAEGLAAAGAHVRWFGHPLRSLMRGRKAEGQAGAVAVLPGSRNHEIEANLPVMAEALRGWPGPIRIKVAPNLSVSEMQSIWNRAGGGSAEWMAESRAALDAAQVALVCSGTATLECALIDLPTVVMYRGSKLMEVEYHVLKRLGWKPPTFFSLPNIFMNRAVVPEYLQHAAHPAALRDHLERLATPGPERDAQLADFAELRTTLGGEYAIESTADWIQNGLF